MLTVDDCFKRLSFGHFSNLSLGTDGSGVIRESDTNKVINAMNEALTRIYARFCLQEKEVMIEQQAHITNYHLDKRFAMFNSERLPEHIPYILDLPNEQFNNDALSIITAFSFTGRNYAINEEHNPLSLFTPSPTVLQVPYPKQGEPLTVLYQASHARLEYGVKQAEIILPLVLEDAFFARVAYRIYTGMNTQEATVKAAEHLQMYDLVCNEVEDKGHASISNPSSGKFCQRGFV